MTRLILDPEPRLQAANVTIHHLQLRDLIQPVGKDKVLFVNKFRIEQADFSSPTPKPNTTFCTLDFSPNCISVGCGLLAAGGQQSELAIRPLHSPSSTSSSRDRDRDRPAPWLLKTPTGGSINNAISIEYDTDYKPQASTSQLPSGTSETRNTNWNALYWTRDEPGGRLRNESHNPDHQMQLDQDQRSLQEEDYLYLDEVGEGVEAGVDENMDLESDALAAAYGFSRTPTLAPSRGSRTSTSRDPQRSSKANSASNPTLNNLSAQQHPQLPIRLMISNNDQSIKIYRLRQPTSTPGQDGRLESGLPGLTRVNTIEFPTCVNHSSISPSNRNLIAVGDTPDVFLYSFDKEGKFEKIATYLASSDASFSTAWHPDGHQMAVASQDGIISVWDVRSSKKIASLSTSQSGSSNGAARCLKYSPNGNYLAFAEHRNYFHIVDTLSYTDHQKIMVKPASALGDSLSERASSTHGEGSSSTTRGVPGLMRTRPMQDFRQRFQEHQWQSSSSRRNGNGDGNSSGRAVTLEDLLARNEILSRIRPSNRASNSPDSRTLHQDEVDEVLATTSSLTNSSDEPSWEDSLPIFGRVIEPGWELPRIRNFNSGWNLVPPSSSRSREPSINIAGLCFCPSGEAVYCATENLIARYSFVDTRRSSQNCGLR